MTTDEELNNFIQTAAFSLNTAISQAREAGLYVEIETRDVIKKGHPRSEIIDITVYRQLGESDNGE